MLLPAKVPVQNLFKPAFFATLLSTLLALLLPATEVLVVKDWVASWLLGARWLEQSDIPQHSDKWMHSGLFLTLGFLAICAWRSPLQRWGWVSTLLVLGAVTEFLQAWVPGRSPSLADFVADALGLALGAWLGWWAFSNRVLSERGPA